MTKNYRIYRGVIRAVKHKRAVNFRRASIYVVFDIADSNVYVEIYPPNKSVDIDTPDGEIANRMITWGLRRSLRKYYPEEYTRFFGKGTTKHAKGLFKPEVKDAK